MGWLMVGTGMLWFFDSEVLGFLVCWFLFGWIRAEGFPGVYVGLLGFFFLFWDAGFLSFPLFCGTFGFFSFLFFSCSGGSGVLSHGAGFGLGFHGYVRIGTSDTL